MPAERGAAPAPDHRADTMPSMRALLAAGAAARALCTPPSGPEAPARDRAATGRAPDRRDAA